MTPSRFWWRGNSRPYSFESRWLDFNISDSSYSTPFFLEMARKLNNCRAGGDGEDTSSVRVVEHGVSTGCSIRFLFVLRTDHGQSWFSFQRGGHRCYQHVARSEHRPAERLWFLSPIWQYCRQESTSCLRLEMSVVVNTLHKPRIIL